ncbi:LysE family translocator [Paraburkholderia sartisoli]|uniref:LysE type translocator n=1 Tax=Paraburkholderia sartisoli TaxID=83784 RepID=A0A1H4GS49_9BURK|nr:LysE family transporter [Paraburkholderia sartisoli]SEB12347.1 LysE type translocator [Paraburkholderia sartisoli]
MTSDSPTRTDRDVILHTILVNVLNPKLLIFFVFLPQFIDRGENQPALRMLELLLMFLATTFVGFVAHGVFAARVRDRILSPPCFPQMDAPELCCRVRPGRVKQALALSRHVHAQSAVELY